MHEIIPFGPYMLNIFNLAEFLIGLTMITGGIFLFSRYMYPRKVSFIQVLGMTYLIGFGLAFTCYSARKNQERGVGTGGIYSFYGVREMMRRTHSQEPVIQYVVDKN